MTIPLLARSFAGSILLIAALATGPAAAQLAEFRGASVGYTFDAPVDFGPKGSLTFHTVRVDAARPLVLGPLLLIPALRYQLTRVEQEAPNAAAPGVRDLHFAALGLSGVFPLSSSWRISLTGGLNLASDLVESLSLHDFSLSGTALVLYTFSPHFSAGLGVSYDGRTGDLLPVPVGLLAWEPVSNFAIRGLVPSNFSIAFRPEPHVTLELVALLDGERYHLGSPAGQSQEVALSQVRTGAGVRLHLTKGLHLELLGGVVPWRRFETFSSGASTANFRPSMNPFVAVNFWLGLSGWRSDLPTPAPAETGPSTDPADAAR